MFSFLKKKKCNHEFKLKDLDCTGIRPPEKPINGYYSDWVKYFDEFFNGEYTNKRIKWPCYKCGEIFYGHCGLSISSKYGRIVG